MKFILPKVFMGLCGIFCFSISSAAGQCVNKSTNYQPKVFESITNKNTRAQIISRYIQFVSYYCSHDFTNVYKMLGANYLKSIKKISGEEISEQEWINERREFYSDEKTRFLSFTPKEVIEIFDEKGNIISWKIFGCLNEIINGKKRKIEAATDVNKQNDIIYFSPVTPIYYSLDGQTKKCR
jgi:hypothetical protein